MPRLRHPCPYPRTTKTLEWAGFATYACSIHRLRGSADAKMGITTPIWTSGARILGCSNAMTAALASRSSVGLCMQGCASLKSPSDKKHMGGTLRSARRWWISWRYSNVVVSEPQRGPFKRLDFLRKEKQLSVSVNVVTTHLFVLASIKFLSAPIHQISSKYFGPCLHSLERAKRHKWLVYYHFCIFARFEAAP